MILDRAPNQDGRAQAAYFSAAASLLVMAVLDPAIHSEVRLAPSKLQGRMYARVKAGHDEVGVASRGSKPNRAVIGQLRP